MARLSGARTRQNWCSLLRQCLARKTILPNASLTEELIGPSCRAGTLARVAYAEGAWSDLPRAQNRGAHPEHAGTRTSGRPELSSPNWPRNLPCGDIPERRLRTFRAPCMRESAQL